MTEHGQEARTRRSFLTAAAAAIGALAVQSVATVAASNGTGVQGVATATSAPG